MASVDQKICVRGAKHVHGTCAELLTIFHQKLDSPTKHHHNWLHQAKECRALKESLGEDEIVLDVDFSENFSCKLNSDVQAFHFGGSWKQATIIHTYMRSLYSSRLTALCNHLCIPSA